MFTTSGEMVARKHAQNIIGDILNYIDRWVTISLDSMSKPAIARWPVDA